MWVALFAGLLYLVILGLCASMAWDMWADEGAMMRVVSIGMVAAVIVMPLALWPSGDPNADRLCLRGHEQWVTRRGSMLVGKMIVPTTSTTKDWFCEQWEAR